MIKKRCGAIINISSIVGVMGNAGQANYAASKAGVIGMTKSVAREVASRGITCNAIAPGFIETDMTAVLKEDIVKQMIAQIPMKKLGQAEDVAETAVFLAKSKYITGQVIHVNGGMAMY
jgi:3-oxoacyl-[acyl-carrier protein] reductase